MKVIITNRKTLDQFDLMNGSLEQFADYIALCETDEIQQLGLALCDLMDKVNEANKVAALTYIAKSFEEAVAATEEEPESIPEGVTIQ